MEKRNILDIALDYGDIKFQLGQMSTIKIANSANYSEKEYEKLNRKRNEILDELWNAYNVI